MSNDKRGRKVNVTKGKQGFQETEKSAPVGANLSDMASTRITDLTQFRENAEAELAFDAQFIADHETVVAMLRTKQAMYDNQYSEITVGLYEWDHNQITANPSSVTDRKTGEVIPLPDHPFDSKVSGPVGNAWSQRGLEALIAEHPDGEVKISIPVEPYYQDHVGVELTKVEKTLAEAHNRADFLEREIIKADHAIMSERLNDSGLPGAKLDVIYGPSTPGGNDHRFAVGYVSTIDEDWPEGGADEGLYDPETMTESEYNEVTERIETLANETYSQTALRAIAKGRGDEFASTVGRGDADAYTEGQYLSYSDLAEQTKNPNRIVEKCATCGDSIDLPNKGLGRANAAAWRTRHQH
jgi:hypothetical protein